MRTSIFFRVDGGEDVGLGHLIRSIALSKSLKRMLPSADIFFVGKKTPYMSRKLEEEAIPFMALESSSDFERFIDLVKKQTPSLTFIDTNYSYEKREIARLNHLSKVVLFNNLYEGAFEAYCTIIPNAHRATKELSLYKEQPRFYYGFDYSLINDRVLASCRNTRRLKKGQIGITTGGSDPVNVLMQLLHMLKNPKLQDKKMVAFYGENYMYKEELFEFIKNYEGDNLSAVPYEFEQLISSEVVISTFGVSTYELLYSGKPIINIGHSYFNAEAARILNERYDCFVDWGYIGNVDSAKCVDSILELFNSPERMTYFANRGQELVDGKGLERITKILVEILNDGK